MLLNWDHFLFILSPKNANRSGIIGCCGESFNQRFSLFPSHCISSSHRCTRVENPGRHLIFLPKSREGIQGFDNKTSRGVPWFGFYRNFINKFFKNLTRRWGGAASSPLPLPPCVHLLPKSILKSICLQYYFYYFILLTTLVDSICNNGNAQLSLMDFLLSR